MELFYNYIFPYIGDVTTYSFIKMQIVNRICKWL